MSRRVKYLWDTQDVSGRVGEMWTCHCEPRRGEAIPFL